MNKTKADAQETRQNLLNAAMECFRENGYGATSLNMVALKADYTRGAVYWHFKDKADLFRAVCEECMEKGDVVGFAHSLPLEMPFQEKLTEVFWRAQEDPYVNFIHKAVSIVSTVDGFEDIREGLQVIKIKLFRYFAEETRLYIRTHKMDPKFDAEVYASDLTLLFEGLFFVKNMNVGIARERDDIDRYVRLIIDDLIS